ncbi:glycosyltransferase [Candidatus Bathyarchaeota archaeon]|nr:glycosyltransferase [Candidatus Bathyarchaeota archaeon]
MVPVVTIGICVKNSESTLREAIESVVGQDFPHYLMEIIFVDDGSEDATLSIINEYVSRIDVSTKVFSTEWRGLSPARNTVVDNAAGKYILWLDGDMILPSDNVRQQVEFMEQNPKVGIAKTRLLIKGPGKIVATLQLIPRIVDDAKSRELGMQKSKLPGTGGAIFRVEAIRQVGGFDNALKGCGEDQDAAYRVSVAGWLLAQSPTFCCEVRNGSWKTLWNRYFWRGQGSYYLYCKNRKIFSVYKMNPIAGFMAGVLQIPAAYRLTGRKSVFLLPAYFTFIFTAWPLGFFKASVEHDVSSLRRKPY